ncbi:zinc-dependent peptidase [Lampropedia puyangensis]|uniref:Zinc-dependent peptidase n=1 Tax=Lampropedia puyangensis TaxID=1330072 RepID=A0A4S8FCB4_9BURK|nr:M90 family metallopeptidase [Lampropedia puyangensis]THU05017.1 zinc-dependent peptidase [Lampropedia puyangensis]
MWKWLMGQGASEKQVRRVQSQIDDSLWNDLWRSMPFLHGLTSQEQAALKRKSAWFLASKTWDGVGGLQVTDAMALCISMQASLPILYLGEQWYEGWSGVLVYPHAFITAHSHVDGSGVVHRQRAVTYGETWEGGPIILSWEAVQPVPEPEQAQERALHSNVVIHEFAHKLDMAHGAADGMPYLRGTGIDPEQWLHTLEAAWQRFARTVELLDAAIGLDVDPDSAQGQAVYQGLPLDAYAAEDTVEFFAVSSEAFFIDPLPLQQWHPAWYSLLSRFYRQDPAARITINARRGFQATLD